MRFTKSGEKVTGLRGHDRLYLVEAAHGLSITIIETKPGARIEDIDTRVVQRGENVTWTEHMRATNISRHDGATHPGWYVELPRRNHVGPLTKADALREIRAALPTVHHYF